MIIILDQGNPMRGIALAKEDSKIKTKSDIIFEEADQSIDSRFLYIAPMADTHVSTERPLTKHY